MRLYSSYTHTPTHTHTHKSIPKWSSYWKLTALSTSTFVFQYSLIGTHGEGDGTPFQYSCLGKIPWMEESDRLQPMGSRRVRHDLVTSLSLFTFMHWRRKWQPTPVFLPGESQGRGSLVGCRLMGSHRVGYDWSDLAAAAAISTPSTPCAVFHANRLSLSWCK